MHIPLFLQEKSWYAVHSNLLRFITDELHHSGGTFSSAVVVWSKQHRTPIQQEMILGADHTKQRNITDALADAWFVYQSVRLAGVSCKALEWRFTRDGLEDIFLKLAPFIRKEHLHRILAHMQSCPRCRHNVVILLDGKYGARRFLCSNVDGYWKVEEFGVGVYTGCMANAGAGHFHCRACRPSTLKQMHLIPQSQVIGLTEVLNANTGETEVRYLVKCHDPDVPRHGYELGFDIVQF